MTDESRFDRLATMVCNMTTRGAVYGKAVEELTKLWESLNSSRVEYVVLFYLYGDREEPEYRTTEMENYIHKSADEFEYEDCYRYARHVWETEFHSDLGTQVNIEVVREVTPIGDDHHTKAIKVAEAEYNPAFPDFE